MVRTMIQRAKNDLTKNTSSFVVLFNYIEFFKGEVNCNEGENRLSDRACNKSDCCRHEAANYKEAKHSR